MLVLVWALGLFAAGYELAALVSPGTRRGDRLIASFPLGAGVVTLLSYCISLGADTNLGRPLLWLVLAGVLIVSATARLAAHREREDPRGPGAREASFTALARCELCLLLFVFAFICVTGAITPVWNWDVYSQYLPLAREIFLDRTVSLDASPSPAEIVRAFPPGYKLLIASGYFIHGGIAHPWARGLSPLHAGLLLLLLYRMGRRHLEMTAEQALAGCLLCATLPLFYEFAIVPTSTICFCLYALGAVHFVLERRRGGARGPLILAGVFLGLSYWTSYTGAVLIPCAILLLLILSAASALRRGFPARELSLSPRDWAVLLPLALAPCVPHLIRNYLVLGNPLYPALYGKLGGAWINEWSVPHLVARIVPAKTFYLRPRWEIFHEGFFIQLLFVFSLVSVRWEKRGKSLALGLFCILYWIFYLKLLTWPRSAGISTKLLLPSLIPAALFAGERLTRMLRGRLPRWQGAVILAAVAVWWGFTFAEESFFNAARAQFSRLSPGAVIGLTYGLLMDFDKLLILLGSALCLFTAARPPGKTAGALGPALLLLAISCRPVIECGSAFLDHVRACRRSSACSFWNAAAMPRYLPGADWLDANLPPDAVIGSFDNRTYLYPRRVVPLDTPALWPMYRGMNERQCIALLCATGVTHLSVLDFNDRTHPLWGDSPLFAAMGDPAFLPLIYRSPQQKEPGRELKVYRVVCDGSSAASRRLNPVRTGL